MKKFLVIMSMFAVLGLGFMASGLNKTKADMYVDNGIVYGFDETVTDVVVIPATYQDGDNIVNITSITYNSRKGNPYQGKTNITALDLTGAIYLETIGANAFKNCSALTGTLYLPSSLSTLGSAAFDGTNLTKVEIAGNGSSVISISANSLPSTVTTVTFPSTTVQEAYEADATWSNFLQGKTIIVPANVVLTDGTNSVTTNVTMTVGETFGDKYLTIYNNYKNSFEREIDKIYQNDVEVDSNTVFDGSTLTVSLVAPATIENNETVNATYGDNTILTVTEQNNAEYYWYKNETLIDSATTNEYTLTENAQNNLEIVCIVKVGGLEVEKTTFTVNIAPKQISYSFNLNSQYYYTQGANIDFVNNFDYSNLVDVIIKDNNQNVVNQNALVVGEYTVMLQLKAEYQNNYSLSCNSASFEIIPSIVNISWLGKSIYSVGLNNSDTKSIKFTLQGDVIDSLSVATEGTFSATVPGTYHAIITGLNNSNFVLDSNAQLTFDWQIVGVIEADDINWSNLNVRYNGTAQKPTALCEINNQEVNLIVNRQDEKDDFTNAGKFNVVASLPNGYANYEFATNANIKEQTINKALISHTFNFNQEYTYLNRNSIVLIDDKFEFASLVDVIVKDSADKKADMDNLIVGTYSASMSLKPENANNYELECVDAGFTVVKSQVSLDWSTQDVFYVGLNNTEKKGVECEIKGADGAGLSIIIDTQSTFESTKPGEYTAKINGISDEVNFEYVGSTSKTWKIYGKIENADVNWNSDLMVFYNAEAQIPSATVNIDNKDVQLTVSRVDEGDDFTNAGTFYISVELPSEYEYYQMNVGNVLYKILPKQISVIWTNTTFIYDGTPKKPSASVDTGIDGKTVLVYVATDGDIINAGNNYEAHATLSNEPNFELLHSEAYFHITKRPTTIKPASTNVNFVYDGKPHIPAYEFDGDQEVKVYVDATLTDTGVSEIGHYIYTFTANESDNYKKPSDVFVNVYIKPAKIEAKLDNVSVTLSSKLGFNINATANLKETDLSTQKNLEIISDFNNYDLYKVLNVEISGDTDSDSMALNFVMPNVDYSRLRVLKIVDTQMVDQDFSAKDGTVYLDGNGSGTYIFLLKKLPWISTTAGIVTIASVSALVVALIFVIVLIKNRSAVKLEHQINNMVKKTVSEKAEEGTILTKQDIEDLRTLIREQKIKEQQEKKDE